MVFVAGLLNNILRSKSMPADEWRQSTLVAIFKGKEDLPLCENYRGTILTSRTPKTWERVIDRRLREEKTIRKEQFGFMPMKTTIDAIFTVRMLPK